MARHVSIGDAAFSFCLNLTGVVIPNSVKSIGFATFGGCPSLTSVIIPNSVTSIGDYAFNNCVGLTSIVLPGSVTSVGNYAFFLCTNLTTAYFQGNAPPDKGTKLSIPEPGNRLLLSGHHRLGAKVRQRSGHLVGVSAGWRRAIHLHNEQWGYNHYWLYGFQW